MRIERYDNPSRFYEAVAPFLLEHEAEHCLLFGICANLIGQPGLYGNPYLAVVKKGEEVIAVVTVTPPYGMVLSNMADPGALNVIAEDYHQTGRPLPDVLAAKALARAFADEWQARTGYSYKLAIAERVFCLQNVNPVSGVSGHLRRATVEDRGLLVKWIHAFSIEALGIDDRPRIERSVDVALQADLSRRYLWEDGEPVSLVGCGGRTPNGIRIGPVYTPPSLRCRGYASACVAAVSQLLLDEGRTYCFLFTDLSNPTSNHIYQQIGYQPVIDMDQYAFEP
jgi:predicted GNAT family acetyltransferase